MLSFRKFLQGLRIIPKASTESDQQGDLEVLSSDGKLRYHNGTSNSPVVSEAHAATLTNKTIDADLNTLSNIDNNEIKALAGIDATKIADGSVSNAEFQNIGTLGSAAVGVSDTQTLSNKSLVDNSTWIIDDGDATKRLAFQASGITTGTTRTWTAPDADLTVVGTATTQTLTNKSIDADANTITNIENADIKAAAAIDATKIANGSVSNTEFQFLDGATSNIQTQITTHVSASSGVHGVTGSVVGTSDTQTLTNKSLVDASTFIIDDGDATKRLQIQASGIATATTRTWTAPDANLTVVGTDTAQVITNKDIDGGTASNTSRITLPKASKATLDALTRKEATVVYASDEGRVYYDDGTSLRPVGSGSGGLVNLVNLNSAWQPLDTDSVDAETSVGNWVAYADAAGTAPVDMTGGSPNTTITRTTTAGEVLNGAASFEITVSSGATRQGEGVSKLCYIPLGYRGKQVSLEMPFTLSGTISEDDFRLYAYDVTNSVLITPFTYGKVLGTQGRLGASFSIPSNCQQLRVGIHIARAVNTGAVSIYLDDVYLGTKDVSVGLAGSNVQDVTATTSFTAFGTVSNHTSKMQRLGDRAYFEIRVQTGTPTGSTFELNLPVTIDSSKISSNTDGTVVGYVWRGAGAAFASTSSGPFPVFYDGSTTNKLYFATTTSGGGGQTLSKSAGSGFGTNNGAFFKFDIPVLGWDANVTMAESSTFSISSYLANGTRVTGTAPVSLGQYRSYLRNASATTYTETNGSPGTAPTASNGILIYGGNAFGSADSNNEPSKYEIFVGKNKNVAWQFYTTTGRTSAADAQLYDALGTAPQGCYNGYDPSTGIAYITVGVSSSQTGSSAGTNAGTIAAVKDMYFDLVVSENALAVGVQAPRSQVFAQNANGAGSTRTSIRRFTNSTTIGTAITYSDSSTNGAEFLINENGLYAISWAARATAANDMAITKNQTADFAVAVGSMAAGSFTDGTVLKSGTEAGANVTTSCDTTCILAAGDVIRFMAAGTDDGSPRFCSARITKVSN